MEVYYLSPIPKSPISHQLLVFLSKSTLFHWLWNSRKIGLSRGLLIHSYFPVAKLYDCQNAHSITWDHRNAWKVMKNAVKVIAATRSGVWQWGWDQAWQWWTTVVLAVLVLEMVGWAMAVGHWKDGEGGGLRCVDEVAASGSLWPFLDNTWYFM